MRKAFTLIEMLIVISLIGILSALALVSFTGAQRQARDVNRKSDMKQYQTSVEEYASKNEGLYPIHQIAVSISTLCTDLSLTNCSLDPKDPTLVYYYITDANGLGYVLWATLENESTTTYWVVCSNGKNGKTTTSPSSSAGVCPTLQ
ncbi:hypothetical protein A2130_00655 [Candidatus Woesebacteria bacterium GWC2_33_12]|uniref:Uncharacterized protein n=1 Tax=Candidatus Woesebacteria bacterium GW2011_GWB1_33_22 TaxID=1618566 RepID=A0A0F9ZM89_9BACT|nr:MAG: hypothetical protein UR29_C0002G0024 [Candidatus Woesebacteria bacterium GW2011_GWC2_33_12]KKP42496.1 MAG: hypothetical protein UR33_C0002G0072 [Candidatus Woesebacteria bacterium GW2011_GWA2_33_20]KKP45239.1 MAG: hypothetical protein UR35_C0002G0072 [Candidatus Woesebacteria bacterium GW2011_GWB1_33_22]KKP46466.1 MAG: Tfp pilus assembly protein, major pilin PilA [Microgenomates group bacterium GW2011_GWC1_33_28]KKP50909.1 MAG: hypothetical protein UR41_C0002G0073 [Candidatus Woesebacte